MTQTCTHCKESLPTNSFDMNQRECKECRKRYHRTTIGLAKEMLRHQRAASKKRGYAPPAYTANELHTWLTTQPAFNTLFQAWEASDYLKDIKPSIDRINDRSSYSLNNIQLSTSKQNISRYHKDTFDGTNTKHNKAVDMLDMNNNFLQGFHSVAAAARHIGYRARINIQDVCDQKPRQHKMPSGNYKTTIRRSAGGYKWRWSNIPHDNSEII